MKFVLLSCTGPLSNTQHGHMAKSGWWRMCQHRGESVTIAAELLAEGSFRSQLASHSSPHPKPLHLGAAQTPEYPVIPAALKISNEAV